VAYTAGQIVTNALTEAGVLAGGEIANQDDATWVLQVLNDLLDEWASRKSYVYATVFQVFTFLSDTAPITIGPTGDWVWNQVPVRIESAATILQNGNAVDIPIRVRDAAWWANQRVKGIESNVPTDLYYEPDQPNGSLYFWPVMNINDQARLGLWILLSQLAGLGTSMVLPPGYRQAITLTLAEALCGSFGREPSPTLVRRGMTARKAIQGNNDQSPRIATADYGMPNRSQQRQPTFNWITGDLT
jgi:hypothetical protein